MRAQLPHYSIIPTTLILIPIAISMWSINTIIAYNVLPLVSVARSEQLEKCSPSFDVGAFTGTTVAGFSIGSGSSRSELYYPTGISITSNGTMFILDTSNYRILRWQIGEPLGYVVAGGRGNGGGFTQIGATYGMFIDNQQNIYLSEQTNHRATLWYQGNNTASVLVAGGNGAGSTPEKLSSPWGIYVDPNAGIYIVDRGNHRVQLWATGKVFLSRLISRKVSIGLLF